MKKKIRIIIIIGILLLIAYVIKGIMYTKEYDEELLRPKTFYQDIKLEDIESIMLYDSSSKLGEYQLSTEEMEEFVSLLQKVSVYALSPQEARTKGYIVTITKVDGDSLYLEFIPEFIGEVQVVFFKSIVGMSYIVDKGATYLCDSYEIESYLHSIAQRAWYRIEYDEERQRPMTLYQDLKLEDIESITLYDSFVPQLGEYRVEYQFSTEETEEFISLLQQACVYEVCPHDTYVTQMIRQVTITKINGDSLYLEFCRTQFMIDKGAVYLFDSYEVAHYLMDIAEKAWEQKTDEGS